MARTLSRLFSLFDSPGEVFDEVSAGPPRPANWLVPTLLVVLTSLMLLVASSSRQHTAGTVAEMVNAGELSPVQVEAVSGNWDRVSVAAVCLGAAAGTFWSALLLWCIGRFLLQTHFSYWKALEVAGLTSMIVALGTIVTILLITASGDAAARPALSLLVHGLPADSPMRLVLDGLNVFHLWATALLALGLSRLGGVSFKEAAFWVLGYWLFARVAGMMLV